MSFKKKILFFHFSFFILLAIGLLWSSFYYWSLLFFNLSYFFSFYFLRKISVSSKKLFYLVVPLLFINSLYLYLSLLVFSIKILFFLVIGLVFSYYYFRDLRHYLKTDLGFSQKSPFLSLDVATLFIIFFSSSFSYALDYFINIKNWILLLIIILIVAFLSLLNFMVIDSRQERNVFLSLILSFSLAPLLWVLFFLPFNYNILALLFAVFFYTALSFFKLHLSKSISFKKIKYNLLFIFAILLAVLLTSRWR